MIGFLLAAGFSAALTPLVRLVAVRKGWVSPAGNGKHPHPATMGGAAVLASMLATAAILGKGSAVELLPLWVCLGLMFLMGMVDDFVVLSPRVKFGAQFAVAALFLWGLAWSGAHPFSCWTALYLFWLIGVTNALNLLDNMDGLTPGVGAIAALGAAMIYFRGDATSPGMLLVSLSGALVGFLLYNFHPARIFLGDSGSHVVGFTLAAAPLYGLSSNPGAGWAELLAAPALLVVPICDTTFVTISRIRRGIPVSRGGKDHLSHRLQAAGLSERQVALIFYAAGILGWVAAWWIRHALGGGKP
jgi:UDP-GlcNAc:undecaprenyl-phosphate GlcNAc-1-phosphate transferase